MPRESLYEQVTSRSADLIQWLVLDFFRKHAHAHRMEPAADSPATRDEIEALQLPGAGGPGYGPIREMWQLAATALFAAEDHSLALAELLRSEYTILGHAVAARSVVEASGRVFWLLEPELSVTERVARSLGYQYEGWQHLSSLVRPIIDSAPADSQSSEIAERLQRDQDDLLAAADALGMRTESRMKRAWAGERPPSRQQLASSVQTAAGQPHAAALYNYLSGVVHGDIRRLLLYLRPVEHPTGADSHQSASWAQPTLELDEVLNVTRRAVDVLVFAERLYWTYLGWEETWAINGAAQHAMSAMQPPRR